MRFIKLVCLSLLVVGCTNKPTKMEDVIEKGLSRSVAQSKRMAEQLLDQKDRLPRTLDKEGKLETSSSRWWCSGFFPGVLWYLYEDTGDSLLKDYAVDYTMRVEKEQYTTDHHDVGFMLYCSFGNGLRITGNEAYKPILLQGAESLSTRFNKNVGLIRSWDDHKDKWDYPVIIDNLMNLEMLSWASKNSDSTKYMDIALQHADNTMKHHFRPDFSCYHVVSYDTITGQPVIKQTNQGYADESIWSRGHAWGLYGYTMMYRETKDERYLEQAKKIANLLLHHPNMPEDLIPYWDYNAPDIPNALRDASAATIMASALIELSQHTTGEVSKEYLAAAETQLRTLTSDAYLAKEGTNGNFIIMHCVGNMPIDSEIDVPLSYADYYYVEALMRYKKLLDGKNVR